MANKRDARLLDSFAEASGRQTSSLNDSGSVADGITEALKEAASAGMTAQLVGTTSPAAQGPGRAAPCDRLKADDSRARRGASPEEGPKSAIVLLTATHYLLYSEKQNIEEIGMRCEVDALHHGARLVTTREIVVSIDEKFGYGTDAAEGISHRVRANLLYQAKIVGRIKKGGERETAWWPLAE